jgi:multidrug resistance protein MdtO
VASRGDALPLASLRGAVDEAGKWFWSFLKTELSPYPGRAWVVGRITISATLVMLVIMTFRIPNGFLAAIFTLLLSRENPTATFRAGFRVGVAFVLAGAYTMLGIMTMVDDPLTHFVWILGTLFLAFYLVSVVQDYGAAVGFGFMIAGAIPFWDETRLNVNDRVANTLWLAGSVLLGSVITIAVEYVFRRVHPATDLTEGIEARLQLVEDVLKNVAGGLPLDHELEKRISLYSSVGTSRLRRLLVRSGYSTHFISQMNAVVALLGRLVDLATSLRVFSLRQLTTVDAGDRDRCERLANEISGLRRDLKQGLVPHTRELPHQELPSNLPFLPTLERTVALIPHAFAGSESLEKFILAPMDEQVRERLLVPDAFSNPAHIQFALRGMLAATACYVVYMAIDWRGLSTSIATCIVTALSTIGSSRQKQFLRLGGAIIGGFIFGMGAQVFVLPFLDSVTGFAILFAVVTAISAWIATASPRLSYLGVQLALAFYLINMQEFAIQTSLAIARDRVFGVLLGLMFMWIVYEHLWVKNAVDEMQAAFARNLDLFAKLSEQLLNEDQNEAIKQIRQLRDQINAGFLAVNAQADAVVFEFGASRQLKMKIRADFRRWQPSIRTLLLVQVTSAQYRLQRPLNELPEPLDQALVAFERDIARVMRSMANEINGKTLEEAPDIRHSAANLHQQVRKYYEEHNLPVSVQGSDVITLSENLASILAPLYADIHATFAGPLQTLGGLEFRQGEA